MSDENTYDDATEEPTEVNVAFAPPTLNTVVAPDAGDGEDAVLVSISDLPAPTADGGWDDAPSGEVTVNPDGTVVPIEAAEVETPSVAPVTPAGNDAPAPAPVENKTKADLKSEVRVVLDAYTTGDLKDVDGEGNEVPFTKPLTVQRIAKAVQRNRGEGADAPSSGAVNALLLRWQRYGLVNLSEGPTAFEGYTDTARTEGFKATQIAYREAQKAARAASKEAAAPAAAPVEVASDDSPEATAPAEQVDPVEADAPADETAVAPAPFDN